MDRPIISLMVAAAENNVIGKDNRLLWHLPDDLKFFKQTTSGHSIIMGRKTYESVGRPLPNRRNLIITRQARYTVEGAEVVQSLNDALARCTSEKEVFVVGGGEIYRLALPLADRIYMTRVHAVPEGDVYFPVLNPEDWSLVWSEHHEPDERHNVGFTFMRYDKESKK